MTNVMIETEQGDNVITISNKLETEWINSLHFLELDYRNQLILAR